MSKPGLLEQLGPLPDDPTIDALDAPTRKLISAIWFDRATSELTAAAGFSYLAGVLIQRDLPLEVQWLAARAVTDELRHAELCRRVAVAFGATDTVKLRCRPAKPHTWQAPTEVVPVLTVLAATCVNETLGATFIQRFLEQTRSPLIKNVGRTLLRDEIDHGRIGWAYTVSLSQETRKLVEERLDILVAACIDTWFDRIRTLPKASAPAYGCPEPEQIPYMLRDALANLVFPGFAHVGISPVRAVAWLSRETWGLHA